MKAKEKEEAKNVILEFKQSNHKNFKDWAIEKIVKLKKTNLQLAGDFGKALSIIGDLEIKINEVYNP